MRERFESGLIAAGLSMPKKGKRANEGWQHAWITKLRFNFGLSGDTHPINKSCAPV